MKKILVLGGTAQQIKLVEAAKQMGVYTIVVDYLNDSPAKKVADEAYLSWARTRLSDLISEDAAEKK